MPSYRSQVCRMLIKYLVATKFNPDKTINEMRRGVENLSKLAGLPSKTNVEKIKLTRIIFIVEGLIINQARLLVV